MIGTPSTHTNAGNLLNGLIDLDQQHIDLTDLLKGSTSNCYTHPLLENVTPFAKFNSSTLPKNLAETAFDDVESHTIFQGILPELDLIWYSKDNILYFWDYVNGLDKRYSEQDQVINDVGVIKPKPGVFDKSVQHALVVTTPVEVILIGIERKYSDGFSLTLYKELSATTNGVEMTSICGTDNGRIFMCGKYNHHIYEIQYKGPSLLKTSARQFLPTSSCSVHRWTGKSNVFGLFSPDTQSNSKRKGLIIDNERNVLYAYSDTSIELYYLGSTTNEFKCIAKNTDIANSALLMCRQDSMLYAASDFAINGLQIVPNSESRKIHLVAITKHGFRLYFTHQRDSLRTNYIYPSNIKLPPDSLELVHVRLPSPPVSSINPTIQANPQVNKSYYGSGVLLVSQPCSDDGDIVYMSSVAVGNTLVGNSYQQYPYVETVSSLNINTKVWSIVEANSPNKGKYPINDIGSQLTEQPRTFLMLTDSGLSFFNKQRPIDMLQQLLRSYDESKIENFQRDLQIFIGQYGQTQVCAMCLGIFCFEEDEISQRAKQVFFDYGGNPSVITHGTHADQAVGQTNVNYSGKRDGLALYFSRLVSDVWKTKVFEIIPQKAQVEFSNRMQSKLFSAQRNLSKLKQFMDLNPEFHNPTSVQDNTFQSNDNNMLRPLLAEQQSLHELYQLLTQCIEAISFIDFIIDVNLKDVLRCVPESIRAEMMETTLESMLTSSRGVELKRDLVIAAIYKYGSNYLHAGYNLISNSLQRKCPSFFKPSDMAFFKGIESLACATRDDVDYERIIALNESLKYLQEAADTITGDKLKEICTEYRYQGYYIGVVKLALERAKRLDPQNQGLTYVESTGSLVSPPTQQTESMALDNDSKSHFYQLRLQCYEQIFQALAEVRSLRRGDRVEVRGRQIHSNNPDILADEVLSTALSSNDILFHYTLYQWFLVGSKNDNSMLTELLSVDTEYIVPFLKEFVQVFEGLDFLWKYYRRREQYFEAALYLEALAMESPDLDTNQRMEYLGMATLYARAREPKYLERQEAAQFIQRLEQQMEQLRTTMQQ
ncbi:Non-repetitive/WGA-negative nucleoporin C-terminal-domain-containing protein [Chlamydoabsidia padenii]|nr:Non-repetitive/WGA-negative nucleoporin C-terminal-domain-containing protein [Chlamydoabsidia padenii]